MLCFRAGKITHSQSEPDSWSREVEVAAAQVGPEPEVTEIRVHGVGGAAPEAMLGQTGVRQVAGDAIAGFYRGATGVPGRTVEAYSWGGLTARSPSRAFWVLLLPFSLVNLAGWMVEPGPHESAATAEGRPRRTAGTKCHEVLVQLIGLLVTTLYVVWAAQLAMNLVAFQCGAIPDCRDRWGLRVLGTQFFADQPGRRVVAALVVPLGLLALFWWLGRHSARLYDEYARDERAEYTQDNQAAAGSVLATPGCWNPARWRAQLVLAHVAVVLLTLASLLAWTAAGMRNQFALGPVAELGYLLLGLCILASLAVAAVVGWATAVRTPQPGRTGWVWVALQALAGGGGLALATAGVLVWRLDLPDQALLETVPDGNGEVVRPATDLWGFGWAPILLLTAAVVLVGLFSVVQLWRWFVAGRLFFDQFAVVAMLVLTVLWPHATVVAVVTLAVGAVAQLLGVVLAAARGPDRSDRGGVAWWRFAVFAGVCLAGAAAGRLTADAPDPFGPGWPRLTPLLLFVAILLLLNLVRVGAEGRPWPVPLALVAGPAGLVAAAAIAHRLGAPIAWLVLAALLSWVLLALAWLAQFSYSGRWRWNGPAAAVALALALLMGVFAALATGLAELLERDSTGFVLRSTGMYEWLAQAFAGMLAALALGLGAWYGLVRLGIGKPARQAGEPDRQTGDDAGRPRGVWARTLAEAVRAVDVVLTLPSLLLAGGLIALLSHLADQHRSNWLDWIDDRPPPEWEPAVAAARWVSLLAVLGLFLAVRNGLRDQAFRSRIGIAWDVVTFFPRWFHPFAPPAYSTRAVPELQARLAEAVQGNGGAVVLSAHSQGSVVAVAALASLRPEVVAQIRLVTHGAPLVRFYHHYFPASFTRRLLDDCACRLGPTRELADGGWLNFWRDTDPVGDPVFGSTGRRPPPDRPPLAVRQALGPDRLATLPDIRLDDPLPRRPYQAEPPVLSHFRYETDPAMAGTLAALATELATAGARDRLDPLPPRDDHDENWSSQEA